MKRCKMCGKAFEVLYPDLWAYRRGDTRGYTFFCSWGCLRRWDKRKEKKEEMGRPRKDGTPARKPERKPKVDLTAESEELTKTDKPDEEKIVLVYDPSIAEEYRKEHPEQYERMKAEKKEALREWLPLEPCGLKSRVITANYEYDEENKLFMMKGPGLSMNMLLMTPSEWRRLSAEILQALEQMGL